MKTMSVRLFSEGKLYTLRGEKLVSAFYQRQDFMMIITRYSLPNFVKLMHSYIVYHTPLTVSDNLPEYFSIISYDWQSEYLEIIGKDDSVATLNAFASIPNQVVSQITL